MSTRSKLVVIYGPPFAGTNAVAWALARSLPGKSAVVSFEALLAGAIAVPDEDPFAELEMVYTQVKLLVANYLKNGYNVVVEGPYAHECSGAILRQEQEIDQLLALMRNLADRPLVARLDVDDEAIASRARGAHRETEATAALRVNAAYEERHDPRFIRLDTGNLNVNEMADRIREALSTPGRL